MTELFGSASVLLTRIDDTDYLAVRAVYAVKGSEPPALYCLESEWEAMPMARIADLHRKVAELESQLAAVLEARPAAREPQAPDATPAQNQARQFQAQAAYIGGDVAPCPDCGKGDWKSARALQMHRQRAHQGMIAGKAQPQQFVEELGWRCAAKGCTGAHARDLHDPAFCTLHATRSTNGHAAVAS